MRLDKLQLDLRPRPHTQALDLGLVLLRANLAHVYLAWLALWLPLVTLCGALAYLFPERAALSWLLAWWLKPMLERAPLYILSRQVFGEAVTWREALRAWPGQLRGGWFRLLTWWRPTMPGRGLYQPIWQLEGARGAVAAERRRVIGADRTGSAAFWFGTVCAHFELILQVGLLAFIGIFLSDEHAIHPFAYLFGDHQPLPWLMLAVTFAAVAFSGGIIGPVYIACCFTLYLNRRATLEAWDIEIKLRQIEPPAAGNARAGAAILLLPLALLLTLPGISEAAESRQGMLSCNAPEWLAERMEKRAASRGPDQNAKQAGVRRDVAELYASDDLRGYACEKTWHYRRASDAPEKAAKPPPALPDLSMLAEAIKIVLIAGAICLVAWLLYRYRDSFPAFARTAPPRKATEIQGLDIRPETLPDNVAEEARRLWSQGQRRAALALLYRATLSRLAHEDGVALPHSATEGDCLRLARRAHAEHRLDETTLRLVTNATELWVNGAYGARWPADELFAASCEQWHAHFGRSRASGRVPS